MAVPQIPMLQSMPYFALFMTAISLWLVARRALLACSCFLGLTGLVVVNITFANTLVLQGAMAAACAALSALVGAFAWPVAKTSGRVALVLLAVVVCATLIQANNRMGGVW